MRKKGFTLIELLAVIVILAVIALIATPIILNIIGDTKINAKQRSIENYIDAVELSIANEQMKNSHINFDGTYEISELGKIITRDQDTVLDVKYDGEGLSQGTITINKGKVIKITAGKISNTYVSYDNNKVQILNKNESNMLITGSDFSSAINKLANSNITSITFLSNGKLPNGYSLDEIKKLDSVDVTLNKTKAINAYYDGNGNIYVYSDDIIYANEDCSDMFYNGNYLLDITNLNTSNVKNMYSMFDSYVDLSNIIGLENLDTSNVVVMNYLFWDAKSTESLNLSKWNVSSVTDMSNMFNSFSGSSLNLNDWNVSNVENFYHTFYNSSFSNSISLENWVITATNSHNIFNNITVPTLDLSSWDVSQMSLPSYMFRYAKIDNLNLSGWNIEYLNQMFYSFEGKNIDLSNWKFLDDVSDLSYMFSYSNTLETVNLSGWDTSNITNMYDMFYDCSNLTNIIGIENLNTSKVTDMGDMFNGCSSLKTLNLSNWDNSNSDMYDMFDGTTNLTCIQVGEKWDKSKETSDIFTGSGVSSTQTDACVVNGS